MLFVFATHSCKPNEGLLYKFCVHCQDHNKSKNVTKQSLCLEIIIMRQFEHSMSMLSAVIKVGELFSISETLETDIQILVGQVKRSICEPAKISNKTVRTCLAESH